MAKKIIIVRDEPQFLELHFWTGAESPTKYFIVWPLIFIISLGIFFSLTNFLLNFPQFQALSVLILLIIFVFALLFFKKQLNTPCIYIFDAVTCEIRLSEFVIRTMMRKIPFDHIESCQFSIYGHVGGWSSYIRKMGKKGEKISNKSIAISIWFNTLEGERSKSHGTNKIWLKFDEWNKLREKIIVFFSNNNVIFEID